MWRWHRAGLMSKLWVSFKTYNICITAFQKGSFTPVFIGSQKMTRCITMLRSCGRFYPHWRTLPCVGSFYCTGWWLCLTKSKLNPSRSRCSVGFHSHWKRRFFLACCRPDHQVSPAAPKMILLTNNHRKRSSCVSRTPPNDSLYYQTFTFDLIHLSQSHLDSLQEPLDSIVLSHLCAWSQEDANRLRGWEELWGVNTLCWLSWRKTCSVDPTRRSARKHFISS